MKLLLVLALVSATLIGSNCAIFDDVKKGEVVEAAHPLQEVERPVDVAKPLPLPLPVVLDHGKDKEPVESDDVIKSRRECERRFQRCYRDCEYIEYEYEGRYCLRWCEREYYDCLERFEYRPLTKVSSI